MYWPPLVISAQPKYGQPVRQDLAGKPVVGCAPRAPYRVGPDPRTSIWPSARMRPHCKAGHTSAPDHLVHVQQETLLAFPGASIHIPPNDLDPIRLPGAEHIKRAVERTGSGTTHQNQPSRPVLSGSLQVGWPGAPSHHRGSYRAHGARDPAQVILINIGANRISRPPTTSSMAAAAIVPELVALLPASFTSALSAASNRQPKQLRR